MFTESTKKKKENPIPFWDKVYGDAWKDDCVYGKLMRDFVSMYRPRLKKIENELENWSVAESHKGVPYHHSFLYNQNGYSCMKILRWNYNPMYIVKHRKMASHSGTQKIFFFFFYICIT